MSELEDFVRSEQVSLWSELDEAIRSAVNRAWSMRASNVARRIVRAVRLVGPTPNGELPYVLVASGVYEAVLRAGGIVPDLPDEAEWQRLDEMMGKYGATRESAKQQYAGTVAAIQTERETNWIAGGDE